MSRIGNMPIQVPAGVKVAVNGRQVAVEGPKGKLSQELHPLVEVRAESSTLLRVVSRASTRQARSLHGLSRSLVANMVTGVTRGFSRGLEIEGVGYRAQTKGRTLLLSLGFSHQVEFDPPEGVTIEVADNTRITVRGADKQKVGETAARIRRFYPPEPYKGKGIRYQGEQIRRKEGKAGG